MTRTWGHLLPLILTLALVSTACAASTDEAGTEDSTADEPTTASEADTASESVTDADSGFADTAENSSALSAGDGSDESADSDEMSFDRRDADTSGSARANPLGESDREVDEAVRRDSETAQSAETTADGGLFDDGPDGRNDESLAIGVRPFVETERDPLSTFALDVDTGSYSLARRAIEAGHQPDPASVRPEEFVNSFTYDYDTPDDGLAVSADAGPSPFDDKNIVLRVGVQAERVAADARPDAALTFVVDTSGSMDRADRLGLVKSSLRRLVEGLDGDDTVAIVTYADRAQVILEPTSITREEVILDAIDQLRPTGSTNLEAGLIEGYELARSVATTDGINRVVLASDGIANVGLTDPVGLAQMIRNDADAGIQLVTVGVGLDGFNDELMEQLADRGDGFYAYIDDQSEADRLFGDELVAALLTVALDAKIQVEFNTEVVTAYRLIGFENRGVLDQDFRNDAVDAGELGAGHQVTALYELTLSDRFDEFGADDALGTVRLRWEDPDDRSVDETSLPLYTELVTERWSATSEDFRLAVTVATWAEVLRGSPFAQGITSEQVWAEADQLSPGNGPLQEWANLVAQTSSR